MLNPTDASGGGPTGTRIDLETLIALRQEARQLQIAPRGKVLATRSGGHLSRFRGRGMEYDESRVYQPGDDPRNMDWRVTARSSTAHVKLFREERERPVWLFVDQRPAMRFASRVAFKSVVAAHAAALLAWAAADKGDRVGGLVFDDGRYVEYRPAARTRGLLPLLHALTEFSEAGGEGAPGGELGTGTPDGALTAAATHLVQLVRPGSLVFLISDFAAFGAGDDAWIARLAAGSELVFVHVFDPLDEAPPPAARYPVTDGDTGRVLDTGSAALRAAWTARFDAQVGHLETLCRHYQAHRVALRTDQPVGDALRHGLRPRLLRSGGIR